MSNKIISFRGYINGERKSSPELSKTISELIDNRNIKWIKSCYGYY